MTPTGAPLATGAKHPANVGVWVNSVEWTAIGFSLDGPHYYSYSCPGTTGATAGFTARANGDIDGDGDQSTFARAANVANGELRAPHSDHLRARVSAPVSCSHARRHTRRPAAP